MSQQPVRALLIFGPRGASLRDAFEREYPWLDAALGETAHLSALGDPSVRGEKFEVHLGEQGQDLGSLRSEWQGIRKDRGSTSPALAHVESQACMELDLKRSALPAIVIWPDAEWKSPQVLGISPWLHSPNGAADLMNVLGQILGTQNLIQLRSEYPSENNHALAARLVRGIADRQPFAEQTFESDITEEKERQKLFVSWGVDGPCAPRRHTLIAHLIRKSEPVKAIVLASELKTLYGPERPESARKRAIENDCGALVPVSSSGRGYEIRCDHRSQVRWALKFWDM